jgi:predicted Zn-dependent protease
MVRRATALFLTTLVVCAAAWAGDNKKKDPGEIGDRNVSKGLNFYSVEQELALGKQLALEVQRQAKIVDDPILSEYINRLGQNLVRNSDVTFPVSFQLIEADEINAFTLPGGYVFINSALVELSANEAELASALAHEVGHVAARHATRQASRDRLMSLGTLPLAVLGGPLAHLGTNAMMPLASMKFSREFEGEADLLGIQYLWKAGYDPNASVDLFEALASTEKRQPGSVAKLFRAHPLTPERIERTQKNIDKLLPARPQYVLNTSEYEDMRARLETLAKKPEEDTKTPTLRRDSASQWEFR